MIEVEDVLKYVEEREIKTRKRVSSTENVLCRFYWSLILKNKPQNREMNNAECDLIKILVDLRHAQIQIRNMYAELWFYLKRYQKLLEK